MQNPEYITSFQHTNVFHADLLQVIHSNLCGDFIYKQEIHF